MIASRFDNQPPDGYQINYMNLFTNEVSPACITWTMGGCLHLQFTVHGVSGFIEKYYDPYQTLFVQLRTKRISPLVVIDIQYPKQYLFCWFESSGLLDIDKVPYDEIDFGPNIIFREGQSSVYRAWEIDEHGNAIVNLNNRHANIFNDTLTTTHRERLIKEKFYYMLMRNLDMTLLRLLPADIIWLVIELLVVPDS